MKRQGGFTLIELVVVIVILGILAVTAAPRFLNLQTDARNASLQGLKGAMAGAAGIVYGKSAIEGSDSNGTAADLVVDGTDINVAWGYPTATDEGIEVAVTGLDDATQWKSVPSTSIASGVATNTIYYTFESTTIPDDGTINNCYISYALTTGGTEPQQPTISVVDCN